uniref:Uncharacterized protein n=2 Tax=Clastoptera arizonana TaxID=38151 RepID=A0A1B6D3N4_9HEMI
MRVSICKIVIFIVVITLSIIIARISTMIKIDSNNNSSSNFEAKVGGAIFEENVEPKIDNSFNQLFWFVQISDIHISIFYDKSRISEFSEFCEKTIGAIKPYVVLASGDLTDAKTRDSLGSKQYEDEWKIYKNTLDKCKVVEKTLWLDVRGNHDNFNVPGRESKENYFRNYSIQGHLNSRSYVHQISGPSGELYSFIALDACLEPGPRRPFNFIGVLTQNEIEHVNLLIKEIEKSRSNYTIWFGHYPTSCILAPGEGVRKFMGLHKNGLAYVCGHLHTLLGTAPHLYTLQQNGLLELELADWKDNRKYRIMAIDHGLFSFVDVDHGKWPVAVITNPKHALFKMPEREPLNAMKSSSHIRVLAFSTAEVVNVSVKLDEGQWQICSHVYGPLYVVPWNPEEFFEKIHHINVHVIDSYGRETYLEQPFALDASRPSFHVFPRLILMSNITHISQILFGLMLVCCIVPLCFLRFLNKLVKGGYITTRLNIVKVWYTKLWILANVDRFFYPIVLYPLYLAIGPWSVGEVIEGYIGVIFIWGTFINNSYLPGAFTYAYAYIQVSKYCFLI